MKKQEFLQMLGLPDKYKKYIMLDEDKCPLIITPAFIVRAICDNYETVEIICWDVIERIRIGTYTNSLIQCDYTEKNGLTYSSVISYHDMKIEAAKRFVNSSTGYFLKETPKKIQINWLTKTKVNPSGLIEDVLGIKIKQKRR